jgi:hypothetical protein
MDKTDLILEKVFQHIQRADFIEEVPIATAIGRSYKINEFLRLFFFKEELAVSFHGWQILRIKDGKALVKERLEEAVKANYDKRTESLTEKFLQDSIK